MRSAAVRNDPPLYLRGRIPATCWAVGYDDMRGNSVHIHLTNRFTIIIDMDALAAFCAKHDIAIDITRSARRLASNALQKPAPAIYAALACFYEETKAPTIHRLVDHMKEDET